MSATKHVAEGDKAAMHIVFVRHRANVLRLIQRMIHDPVIARDLVSQVFLDIWRSVNRLEGHARVSSWLLAIARLKAAGHQKRLKTVGALPDAVVNGSKTSDFLRACIEMLSPSHREVIELSYCGVKSAKEISAIVDVPLATVKSRISYARKQLAKIVVRFGLDDGAAGPNRICEQPGFAARQNVPCCETPRSYRHGRSSDFGPNGDSMNTAGLTF